MTSIKTKLFLAIIIIFFLSLLLPTANDTKAIEEGKLTLKSSSTKVDLYPTLFILVDQDRQLSIDDITSPPYQDEFLPLDLIQQKGGFFSTSKWLRFEIENSSAKDDEWLLEIAFRYIPEIILYEKTNAGIKEIIHTGTNYPFYTRDVDHRNFVFNLPIAPEETKTFYMLLHADGDLHPPLRIWNSDEFLKKTQIEFILLGVFFGITSVMILYNLFLYFGLRMKSYLFYVLTITSTIVVYIQYNGLGYQFLWPNSPFLNSMINPMFVSLTCIFMLLFTRSFLKTDKHLPFFKKYAAILIGANTLVILLLIFSRSIALNLMLISVTSTLILILASGVIALIRGVRQARFFVLAWSVYLIGIFITILTIASIIPYHIMAEYAAQISISLEVILLSLALADNINIIRIEKKLAEQEVIKNQELVLNSLKESDELKDEFLAITSHELRTPLYGMIGIAESIRDGVAGEVSPELNEQLSIIVKSGNRLTNLVNDILDFSKLKHHSLQIELQPVNLFEIVEIIFFISRPLINNKPLQLVNHLTNTLPLVMVDKNRLQQILYNLIGNAIKYSDEGFIEVSAKQRDGRLIVSVTDQGKGIPEDQFETIFYPFRQGDIPESTDTTGTGIGLNITKQLVELHGGTLDIDSVIGKGSTFSFSLAIQSEKSKETASPEIATFLSSVRPSTPEVHTHKKETKAKILVADDEPVNLQLLMNQLTLEGYEVITALDGEEAIKIIHTHSIDLLILDVMMPKMSGYEVCKQLRKDYSLMELPVLMLTAQDQMRDKLLSFEVGANDYLMKPCDKQELLSRVRTLVRLKSLNQKLIELNINLEHKVKARTEALEKVNEKLTKVNFNLVNITESRRQLLANISHELGTPVTLIHSYLQALQNNLVQADDDYFQELVAEKINVLNRLIDDLSDLSILESGETNLNFNKTSIDTWLESVYRQQAFDIKRYNRNFIKQFNKENMHEYYTLLDEERMNQVFSNIISNAVKNTLDETGTIKLVTEVQQEKNKLFIKITDNGSGISNENLPFIFERFYKGTPPTVENAQRGTGLGLAIVKEIIAAHDGSIWVESTLDQGTTFFITLPIYKKN